MNGFYSLLKALRWCAAALSLFLAGCGSSTEFYRDVDRQIGAGEHRLAIDVVRAHRSAYGEKSSVLYNLDMGMLFHYASEPDSSTKYLLMAEKEIEDLYTRSISLEALSFLLNDNIIPYEGEDFEKVMLNVFLALNFAKTGEADEAVVEVRKADLKLRQLTKQYEGKNKYQEDAFIRYIAGVLYESAGETNDAFISYRKAFEAYRDYGKDYGVSTPRFLLDDLVRTATRLGFTGEAESYLSLGGARYTPAAESNGNVMVLIYSGNAPIKTEIRPSVTIPDSSATLHTFQIALPRFVPRLNAPRSYAVSLLADGDSLSQRPTIVEDITAIAGKSLEDRLTLVYLKSGGRALLKFLASEKAKSGIKENKSKLANFLGSIAIDLAVAATEQADVRSWRTLPAQIQLAKFELPPGEYTFHIEALDGGFSLRNAATVVRKGRTSFLIVDDIR